MPLLKNLEQFQNVSPALQWAIFILGCMIIVVAAIACIIGIWLAIKYRVYNRRMNSRGLSGKDAARMILDRNGLQHIRVSVVGSMLFGNSYSHWFKKIRLRRMTTNKPSITSLAMGAEKSALAILDKEGDKDMKTRIYLSPLLYLGPIAFVPIIVIGIVIDVLLFSSSGVSTTIAAAIGIGSYVISFVLSIMTLKTEMKAQNKACEILKEESLATDEEIDMMRELFKLYNIQYINDILLEFLQVLLKVLQIVAKSQHDSATSNNSSTSE